MIGLSLSFCIKDICRGNVAESDVVRIISGTKAQSSQDWVEVFKHYEEVYWKDFPDARVIATRFLSKGLIEQPRLTSDIKVPMIADGHWVDSRLYLVWNPTWVNAQAEELRKFLKNASISDPGPNNKGLDSRRTREGVFEE